MPKGLKVNWKWVESELLRHERIPKKMETISEAADEAVKEAKSLVAPRSVFVTKSIDEAPSLPPKVSSYLKGAGLIYIYAVTIGSGLEKKATSLMSGGEELKGYLLDRVGSLAVESLAEAEEKDLRDLYLAKGKSVSARFSPGYCDWPTEGQLEMAEILDMSEAGISLTERCMMVPKKSISAIIGIGPKGLFNKTASPCVLCDKEDCDYRRRL